MATEGAADQQVDLKDIPISPGGDEPGPSTEDGSGKNAVTTVFHDKENFNVKHPLQNQWTLWFTKPPSGKVRFISFYRQSGLHFMVYSHANLDDG